MNQNLDGIKEKFNRFDYFLSVWQKYTIYKVEKQLTSWK